MQQHLISLKTLTVQPVMDMSLLLSNSRERSIDGLPLHRLTVAWNTWLPHLHAVQIFENSTANSWLAVWLDEAVEQIVDRLWASTPSEAFLYNALAQTLCMSAVYALLPEVAAFGCAPLPGDCAALELALKTIGLRDKSRRNNCHIKRRYAVVTACPFRGGCAICALRAECPRRSFCCASGA